VLDRVLERWNLERRRWFRTEHLRGRKVRIQWRGQWFAARVVDSSDQGLGVESPVPLETNAVVAFVGAGVRGRAQVMHCRQTGERVFRAGLQLEEVRFKGPGQALKAGPEAEPPAQTANLLEGSDHVYFGQTQESSEEKPQINGTEADFSESARETTQQERPWDPAEAPPEGERRASEALSDMAQTVSHALQAALGNIEQYRSEEMNALRRRTEEQIAELKHGVSEQRSELAAAKDALSEARAETENVRRVQEAELPKLKASVGDLSAKLDAAARQVDRLTECVRSLYEVEKLRQSGLQQMTGALGRLETALPAHPDRGPRASDPL